MLATAGWPTRSQLRAVCRAAHYEIRSLVVLSPSALNVDLPLAISSHLGQTDAFTALLVEG